MSANYEQVIKEREAFHEKLMSRAVVREEVDFKPVVDMRYIRALGSVVGNVYKDEH